MDLVAGGLGLGDGLDGGVECGLHILLGRAGLLGSSGNQFIFVHGVNGPITREQLAVMLYRYAGSPAVTGTLDGFSDAADAGSYATDALSWAVEHGIITGKGSGSLDPLGEATRAEVAAMLMRYMKKA